MYHLGWSVGTWASLGSRRLNVDQRLELRLTLSSLAPEIEVSQIRLLQAANARLNIHVIGVPLTLTIRGGHLSVVRPRHDGLRVICLRSEVVINTLEVGTLLELVNLFKVCTHVNGGELVDELLS